MTPRPASERTSKFFERASIAGPTECWLWLGGKRSAGYGYFTHMRNKNKERIYAHRYAKAMALGRKLESAEHLHHTCENKLCVNPRHLTILSRREHPSHHRLTHCKRGHEFAGENLKVTAEGYYVCLTCRRKNQSENRKRRRREGK